MSTDHKGLSSSSVPALFKCFRMSELTFPDNFIFYYLIPWGKQFREILIVTIFKNRNFDGFHSPEPKVF